jgi:hypothetical protein
LEDAFAVARQTQGQKQRKWGWLNKSKEKEGKVRNGGLSHGDVDTCCISTVSSIKPLDIGGIEGFFFGHIWESAHSGPRVVEEWPRVCSGSGDSVLRVEEKMSNNSNYGGGQGRNWQGGNNYGRGPGFNNFMPPYNPNWRNPNWHPQNGGNKENYQQKAMSDPAQKAASSASGGSGASATTAGPSTATSP